jgi:K+-transporting ATPase ATPase C chain
VIIVKRLKGNSNGNDIGSNNIRFLFTKNLNPSIRLVILMILVVGIGYPILLVIIGEVALPFQTNGSLLTSDGKVIGSKLIAQQFTSPMFFHPRPSIESASGVDPHITPENAFGQIPNISRATGIPENVLGTIVELNSERNKVSNGIFFAPPYVNVLEVNMDLAKHYPEIYNEFGLAARSDSQINNQSER